jgi:tRNA pseudouridine synthase 10
MGREDIDARMLGDGRPFIIELKSPRKRFFSAEQLEAKINAAAEGNVVVRGLRFVSHSAVKHLKAARCDKTYRVEVRFATSIGMDELQHAVRQLEGIEVKQRTPTRVLHRRADLVRVRKIKSFELLELAPSGESCTLELTAESGTYIKEFIQGDNDRTVPDFASTLGVPCIVTQLDVMKVHDKPLDLNQIHF